MSRSLGWKLIVAIVGSLGIILLIAGHKVTELHRGSLEEINYESAGRISDSIKSSILYSMQQNHRDEIYHAIQTIGREPGINKIRIFNEVGKISFSSDVSEINTMVNKQAEACYRCHAQEEPLSHLDQPDRLRIYFDDSGDRILGLINPIENRPECYNASCHAHAEDQRILGVLDVTLSLAHIDQLIQEDRTRLILYIVLTMVAMSLGLGVLVWQMVQRPISELMTGTERLAAGELDYRLPILSNDEIGVLGSSFNRMALELQEAQKDLKNWAVTLENRVREKTTELETAHRQMIQVERMASMGKLAAIVAHEINNPLTGILTSARLVAKRLQRGKNNAFQTDDSLEHLELIASESSRCGEIVKSLLQFARPERRKRQPEDLNRLLTDSIRLVQHKIDLLGIEAVLELDPNLPPIMCDGQEIRQVMVAILINGCEAIGSDGGSIRVGTSVLPGGRTARITVTDTGCGMDEETKRRIFEPFFSTKEEVKGVGLGLSVVSGIMASCGGKITVDSEPGRGTTFQLDLPINSERGEATVQQESEECGERSDGREN